MTKVALLCSCVALFLLLSGCGGGTGSAVPLPVNKGIILSAALKQGIPQTSHPIASIQVELVLPKRATPILNTDGSLQISETGLKCLNTNGSVSAGSYDPVTGTVRFILWEPKDPTIGLGTGDIARLTYENSSGTELSPQEIQQTLSYKVVGSGSPDNADISAQFDTSVSGPSVRIVTYLKP
ncbi:MAG: hypothetical protein WA003_06405 [Desulfuromonadaceae bacterium]